MMRILLSFVLIAVTTMLASCEMSKTDAPEPVKAPASTGLILAVGDSLTAGLGVPLEENYPSQLQRKLQEKWYSYEVQNAGISGDTSAELLARMDWLLEWEKTPTFAILEIGANDAFRGLSTENLEKNLRGILQKFKDKNIPVLFTGMQAPYNLGGTYREKFAETYEKLAKEFDVPFMPFFLEWVAMDPQYNQGDRIHPNARGYEVIVGNLIPLLEEHKFITK